MANRLLFLALCSCFAGILLPVAIGQKCELVFSLRKVNQQDKTVQFSGLFASEVAKIKGAVVGNRLTCTCKEVEGGVPAHWVGPSGATVDSDQTANVFYKLVTRRPGTAVNLLAKHKRFFTCADAGEYTCVIGESNRTAVLTPIDNDCGPTDIALTTKPSGPVSRGSTLTLECSADDPTNSGLHYKWLKNGQLLPGETASTLVKSAVEKDDEGVYTCRISNRVGVRTENTTVTVIVTTPTPSPTSETPTCAPRVTLSQMCDSLSNLKTQTLSLEGTSGECTISDDCLNLQCVLIVNFFSSEVPISFNMTLLPCASPYSFELQVISSTLGGEVVNGIYSETTAVPFIVFGFNGLVSITVVQLTDGATISVTATVIGQTLTVIPNPDVYMHCVGICVVSNTTMQATSALPSPSTSSPTSAPPTCAPRVTLSQMCDSLSNLKTQTLSTEGTTGDCTISDDCLNLDCAFTVAYSTLDVPLIQNMTLLPCASPYSFRLIVSSTLLGGVLVNGVYSESDSVPFTALGVSGNVVITVVQQEFGVTVSVAANIPILSLSLTVISQTDVYMHCAGRCPSVPTLQSTAVQPPSPLTAISRPPAPSPTSEPPTCPPRVTLSQMCDSLSNLKTQTLSTEGTTGDCTISDDCLNLDCAFTITYLGINVPLNQSMTLLPCTSPYSFRLIVSSTFLGGELVNGVYSESDSVPFTALGVSGNVAITVVQQEFGATVSVAANIPLLSLSLTVISQTDVYVHCAGRCPSSTPTLQATAVLTPTPSP